MKSNESDEYQKPEAFHLIRHSTICCTHNNIDIMLNDLSGKPVKARSQQPTTTLCVRSQNTKHNDDNDYDDDGSFEVTFLTLQKRDQMPGCYLLLLSFFIPLMIVHL